MWIFFTSIHFWRPYKERRNKKIIYNLGWSWGNFHFGVNYPFNILQFWVQNYLSYLTVLIFFLIIARKNVKIMRYKLSIVRKKNRFLVETSFHTHFLALITLTTKFYNTSPGHIFIDRKKNREDDITNSLRQQQQ